MSEILIPHVVSERDFFNTPLNQLTSLSINKIDQVNWPDTYPYKPDVKFIIGHNEKEIFLRFFVEEQSVLGLVNKDNGEVWTDSCVEFFINLDDSGYYNFEFNCIGSMLLGFRKQRDNFIHANQNILNGIFRNSSLGNQPFAEKKEDTKWELSVKIPTEAFFQHSIKSLSGIKAKGNFYKCGDNLTVPYFLSWNAIDNPSPNFHLEKFFGDIQFE